jgi:hypothetical protein
MAQLSKEHLETQENMDTTENFIDNDTQSSFVNQESTEEMTDLQSKFFLTSHLNDKNAILFQLFEVS